MPYRIDKRRGWTWVNYGPVRKDNYLEELEKLLKMRDEIMNTSEIIDGQWYEVLRPDGNKQYAMGFARENSEPGWLLFGSGFIIHKFDAVSVTPVDEIPDKQKHGIAHFDGMPDYRYKAVVDMNYRWNGWHLPYIHEDDIERLCKHLSYGEEGDSDIQVLEFTTDKTVQHTTYFDENVEYEETIEPTVIEGENYYYMGNGGWTFDFAPYDDEEEMKWLKQEEERYKEREE